MRAIVAIEAIASSRSEKWASLSEGSIAERTENLFGEAPNGSGLGKWKREIHMVFGICHAQPFPGWGKLMHVSQICRDLPCARLTR